MAGACFYCYFLLFWKAGFHFKKWYQAFLRRHQVYPSLSTFHCLYSTWHCLSSDLLWQFPMTHTLHGKMEVSIRYTAPRGGMYLGERQFECMQASMLTMHKEYLMAFHRKTQSNWKKSVDLKSLYQPMALDWTSSINWFPRPWGLWAMMWLSWPEFLEFTSSGWGGRRKCLIYRPPSWSPVVPNKEVVCWRLPSKSMEEIRLIES